MSTIFSAGWAALNELGRRRLQERLHSDLGHMDVWRCREGAEGDN